MRNVRPELLLVENIRTLLYQRRVKAKDLARFCGHEPAWLTKILKGDRGVAVEDLPCIAEFFGLQTHELFQHGIGSERRRHQRRSSTDRRALTDRRHGGHEKGDLRSNVESRFRDTAPPARSRETPARKAC
jgi:transcriptional regulator with XRE-family HTH domain